jgi:hypothetical protein
MTPLVEATCWLVLGVSAAVLVVKEIELRKFVGRQRAGVLRYPLFAVRDDLIRLVSSGRVAEDDEAWATAYVAINNVLSTHSELGPLSYARKYAMFAVALERDAEIRRKVDHHARKVRRLSSRVPEFGEVLDAFDRAIFLTLRKRHRAWHIWRLRLDVVVYTLISAGYSAALLVYRTFLSKVPTEDRPAEISYFAANSIERRAPC